MPAEENHTEIANLIARYLQQDLSEQEIDELTEWIALSRTNANIFRAILDEDELGEMGKVYRSADTKSALRNARQQLMFSPKSSKKATGQRWTQYAAVAAAIAVLLTVALYVFDFERTDFLDQVHDVSSATGIGARNPRATLVLADGRRIELQNDSASLQIDREGIFLSREKVWIDTIESRAHISASAHVLEVPKGGTFRLVLADGTGVWLNAGSSLTFPASFEGKASRSIKLSGEAYFEAAKNKNQPFIVITEKALVQVLGTHFMVNAYSDENSVKTTLIEGSVRVQPRSDDADHAVVLKPGEQAILSGKTLSVVEADIAQTLAWKNGDLAFDDETLESVMRKISRWYDVEIVYDPSVNKQIRFGGGVLRFDRVEKILEKLEKTGGIRFKLTGRRIVVSRSSQDKSSRKIAISWLSVLSHHRTYRSVYGGSLNINKFCGFCDVFKTDKARFL